MKRRLGTGLALCGIAAFIMPVSANAEQAARSVGSASVTPPISAYGDLPTVRDAALSPDGSKIALLVSPGDGTHSILLMTADLKPLRTYGIGDAKVRGITWGGPDYLIVQTSATQALYGFNVEKFEFTSTVVVPTNSSEKPAIVFRNRASLVDNTFGNHGVRLVEGRWYAYFGAIELESSAGEHIYDHGRPALYRVDIATNRPELVQKPGGPKVRRDWLVGRDGRIAAKLDVNLTDGTWTISSSDRAVASGVDAGGDVGLVALGKDGATAIYSTRDNSGASRLYEVPLAGGSATPFEAEEWIDRFYIDPLSGEVLGYLGGKDARLFEPARQAAMGKIRRAFAKYDMRVIDFTPDFKRAIVRTSGNGDSGSWFFIDMDAGRAEAIGYERDTIAASQVGAISTVTYRAADGLELDGILTLPPAREANALPVILLPHGGPASSDRAEFDWWAQAFASRGYAVFQPNFRGSTDRDDAFRRAGHGEWGGKMQTDLSDGLAELARRGIVDLKRACIVGASYGGYAALAGVTLQSGLYRCAVSVSGVSDLADIYAEDYRGSGEAKISKVSLLEELGPRENWTARSPRRNAAKADAPVLLIHGKDDTVVPYTHTTRMADALRDAHKTVEVVTLKDEDHWLSRAETRKQMLEAAVAFVEKHNPPRP